MKQTDHKAVAEIDKLCSGAVALGHKEVRARCKSRKVIGMVAEIDGKVVGFMIYDLRIRHRTVLLDFVVHPDYQRQGVGRAMMERLKEKQTGKRREIKVMVIETNEGALAFFRKMGFLGVRVQRTPYLESYGIDRDGFWLKYTRSEEARVAA